MSEKTITAYSEFLDAFYCPLDDLIRELVSLRRSLPAGSRRSAMVEIDNPYDGGSSRVEITYKRPMTDEETATEKARNALPPYFLVDDTMYRNMVIRVVPFL